MIPESIVLTSTPSHGWVCGSRSLFSDGHICVAPLAASQTFFHIPSRNLVKRQTSKYHIRSEIAQKHVEAAGRLISIRLPGTQSQAAASDSYSSPPSPQPPHPEPRSPLQVEHTLPATGPRGPPLPAEVRLLEEARFPLSERTKERGGGEEGGKKTQRTSLLLHNNKGTHVVYERLLHDRHFNPWSHFLL